MSDPKKTEPKDMLEAVEEGIEKADEETGKKKPKGKNSGLFADLRKKIADRDAAMEEAEK